MNSRIHRNHVGPSCSFAIKWLADCFAAHCEFHPTRDAATPMPPSLPPERIYQMYATDMMGICQPLTFSHFQTVRKEEFPTVKVRRYPYTHFLQYARIIDFSCMLAVSEDKAVLEMRAVRHPPKSHRVCYHQQGDQKYVLLSDYGCLPWDLLE